ncbi:hypothetical protein O181_006552 [Austropuccinia psidii MF-1]|uniref:Uncharacterized protein n=1 Tax=Austropuccinia psidii MF-1 TaxID=1389203 RepID=A0A9Q3BK91_9BASI|nr:hypothetical protein [Austropuccinia psidii MF-1]
MLRWQIDIQDYRGNMITISKEAKIHKNALFLSRWPTDNFKSNPAYYSEVVAKISVHFMELERRRTFRFSEWAPAGDNPDSHQSSKVKKETAILGISS